MRTNLSHVEAWIFDLDSTLYHPSARIFDQINARTTGCNTCELGITGVAAGEQRYGTTLQGLIDGPGIDPARAAKIEDEVRNLEVPKALGMATIWLCHRAGAKAPTVVDRHIARPAPFLQEFT